MIVNPAIVTLFAKLTSNTRLAPEPLIASTPGPGPRIVTFLLMNNSPLVNAMVPETMLEKIIVFVPVALLSRIACRSEPAPLSFAARTILGLGSFILSIGVGLLGAQFVQPVFGFILFCGTYIGLFCWVYERSRRSAGRGALVAYRVYLLNQLTVLVQASAAVARL